MSAQFKGIPGAKGSQAMRRVGKAAQAKHDAMARKIHAVQSIPGSVTRRRQAR